ncbi:hypothetical protein C3488_03715 [Streptomyces sp. Ru72]|nr:hypothetical protein C3488_03715 [Streptomyces sp. Ru72]
MRPGTGFTGLPALPKRVPTTVRVGAPAICTGGCAEETGHVTPPMELRREAVMRGFAAETKGLHVKGWARGQQPRTSFVSTPCSVASVWS